MHAMLSMSMYVMWWKLSQVNYKFTLYSLQQIATDQSVSYYTLHGFVAFLFFIRSDYLQLQK